VSGAWCRFVFDLGACKCQCIKCPCRESRCFRGEPTRPSSEAEPHPRGATALRARRNLTRGDAQPPSRAEPHPTGEAGPRARRKFARVVPRPRAERSSARGWLGRLPGGPPGPPESWVQSLGCEFYLKCVLSSFAFCFFRKKVGFPWLFRRPLWLSPQF
jgi:hypothetical protein